MSIHWMTNLPLEQVGRFLVKPASLLGDRGRMDPIDLCQLGHGLLSLQGPHRDLCLDVRYTAVSSFPPFPSSSVSVGASSFAT